MDRGIDGRRRSRGLNLEVYDLILKPVFAISISSCILAAERSDRVARRKQEGLPFPEPLHTHFQVPSRLELRICYGLDRDIG